MDNVIADTENPKKSVRNLLKLSEFSKVIGDKINIQKSTLFLYTNNAPMELKLKLKHNMTIIQNKINA